METHCPRCNIEWSEKNEKEQSYEWYGCDCGLDLVKRSNSFYYYDNLSSLHFKYPTTWFSHNNKCRIVIFNPNKKRHEVELNKWISFDLEKAKQQIENILLLM
jgi:hypothetical protein